ncbi:MAG: hypothetical protein RSB55_09375, partial [Oscillospiraceae bacterium]
VRQSNIVAYVTGAINGIAAWTANGTGAPLDKGAAETAAAAYADLAGLTDTTRESAIAGFVAAATAVTKWTEEAAKAEATKKYLNTYVTEFIDGKNNRNPDDVVNGIQQKYKLEVFYDATGLLIAPTVKAQKGDYYIKGKTLGQTVLRVTVKGMTAAAYITVRVMADDSSKANPMVAMGTDHTVALKSNGTVWTWGGNANGQLGREDYAMMGQVIFPHQVEQAIAGGYFARNKKTIHQKDGAEITTYQQWYTNSDRNTDFMLEKEWDDKDPVQFVAAGYLTSFAITAAGRSYAWGADDYGQLGVGSLKTDGAGNAKFGVAGTNVLRPMYMADETGKDINPKDVLFGANVDDLDPTLGKTEAQTVSVKPVWDTIHNNYRNTTYLVTNGKEVTKLLASGEGYTAADAAPTAVETTGMGNISQISGGYALASGEVWQLSAVPVKVTGYAKSEGGNLVPVSITQISAGAEHLLALDMYGNVWAFGD